jgi:hypothetical protein
VERVLADIDTDHGDRRAELLRHGVLLDLGAPGKVRLPVGQEHGRTIPLADIAAVASSIISARKQGVAGRVDVDLSSG